MMKPTIKHFSCNVLLSDDNFEDAIDVSQTSKRQTQLDGIEQPKQSMWEHFQRDMQVI